MEISLRKVARIAGLGEEAQVGQLKRSHHGGSVADERQTCLPAKMRVYKEKPQEQQATAKPEKKDI